MLRAHVLQTKILFLAGNLGGVGSEDDDFNDYGYDCDYGIGGSMSRGANR